MGFYIILAINAALISYLTYITVQNKKKISIQEVVVSYSPVTEESIAVLSKVEAETAVTDPAPVLVEELVNVVEQNTGTESNQAKVKKNTKSNTATKPKANRKSEKA